MQELVTAWNLWRHGQPTTDVRLWHHTILFWGRVGKGAEFISALAILVEIIGPARLRHFGMSLDRRFPGQSTLRLFADPFRTLLGCSLCPLLAVPHVRRRVDVRKLILGPTTRMTQIVFWILLAITALFTAIPAVRGFAGSGDITTFFIYYFAFIALAWADGLMAILIAFALVMAMAAIHLLARMVAVLLEREHLDVIVKAASVLLLALGFHFDLLAT